MKVKQEVIEEYKAESPGHDSEKGSNHILDAITGDETISIQGPLTVSADGDFSADGVVKMKPFSHPVKEVPKVLTITGSLINSIPTLLHLLMSYSCMRYKQYPYL